MYCGWSPSRISSPARYPDSGESTPPSSLYCCQRSASISSAAARSWRIATSPALSLCLPLAANALLALPSKAAPGARRAAPMPRLRRKDRLARRRGCGNSWLGFDDSALSRSLVGVGLMSDFIERINIGLVLVSAWHIALPPSLPMPRDFIPKILRVLVTMEKTLDQIVSSPSALDLD